MMPRRPNRTARLEARIAPDALAIVKRAAEMQGRSVSDFVVAAAQEAATLSETKSEPVRKEAIVFAAQDRAATS